MSEDTADAEEKAVGALLRVGTLFSFLAVVVGTCISLALPSAGRLAGMLNTIGVTLFVVLPVMRVILIAVLFARKDRVIFGAALAVLGLIGAGGLGFIAWTQ